MIETEGRSYRTKLNPSVMAVWAALLAVTKLLPSIPIYGTGATFSISSILTPLSGILFGPIPGIIIAAVGGFIGQLLAPHTAWMGILTFLIGVFNAGCAGWVIHKRFYISLSVIGLGTLLWFSTSIGREAYILPLVFYSLGAIAALVGGIWGRKWLLGDKPVLRFLGIFLACYTGFVGAAAYANYLGGLVMMEFPSTMWKGLAFVSPVERAIFSLGGAIVGVPLLYGLPKIGLLVGPQRDF